MTQLDAAGAASLARKMKLGAAARPVVVAGPDTPEGLIEALRAASLASGGPAVATDLADEPAAHDWILFFAATRAALEAQLPAAEAALASPGTLWIGYLKGSSKRQTDLTRDLGWDSLKATDLMWLSLISIDDAWSAFSLRKYKPGEARQTFR